MYRQYIVIYTKHAWPQNLKVDTSKSNDKAVEHRGRAPILTVVATVNSRGKESENQVLKNGTSLTDTGGLPLSVPDPPHVGLSRAAANAGMQTQGPHQASVASRLLQVGAAESPSSTVQCSCCLPVQMQSNDKHQEQPCR
jgi:hypothetical protein